MKKLLISAALLLSTSSFAANLAPKYECELAHPNSDSKPEVITIYVSEGYLCGSENTDYEMAAVTPTSEDNGLGSVDTGTISYSSDFKVTATLKGDIEGKVYGMPITMDISKDGQKNNSTFSVIVGIDEDGNAQYEESMATCSSIVSYNMDC
jgi:hypothetical protein